MANRRILGELGKYILLSLKIEVVLIIIGRKKKTVDGLKSRKLSQDVWGFFFVVVVVSLSNYLKIKIAFIN